MRRRADNKIVVIKLVTFNTNPGHRLYREEDSWLNEPKILAKLNHYDETLTLFGFEGFVSLAKRGKKRLGFSKTLDSSELRFSGM